MRKKSRSSRKNRHRVALADVFSQNIDRLRQSLRLGQHQTKAPPRAPILTDDSYWRERKVELLAAQQIAMELNVDRANLSRMLRAKNILPVYYDGKVPLYPPSVIRDLGDPTPVRQSVRDWQPPSPDQPGTTPPPQLAGS